MKKQIHLTQIDKTLLAKLLKGGVYPLSVTVMVNGNEFGKDLVYLEDEDGKIFGTSHVPAPSVLAHIYTVATMLVPKYPYGAGKNPGGPITVSENNRGIMDDKRRPMAYSFDLNDGGKFAKALSQFNRPFELNVTPEMIEGLLKTMETERVKGCMDEWVEKEWFEYAAVAKKIIEQRNQP